MNRVQLLMGENLSKEMSEDAMLKAIDNILDSDDFILVTRNKKTLDFTVQSRFVTKHRVVLQVMDHVVQQVKAQLEKGESNAV